MNAAQAWFVAGTLPLLLAGTGHAAAAIVDLLRPTWFDPVDPALRTTMQRTPFRLRRRVPLGDRARPSVWLAWLGFNVSHGLGLAAFALVCLLLGLTDDAALDRHAWLAPVAAAVALAYLGLALRCWFWGPVLICGASAACFLVATLG